jgi:hypothetical protein
VYARITQIEIDTLRIDTDSAVELYRSQILPDLRNQPGYAGVLVLANPEGTGAVVTFWETPESADSSGTTGFYAEVLEKFTTIFKTPPGRGHYEVALAELPATTT